MSTCLNVGPVATFVLSTGCAKLRLAVEVPSHGGKYISKLFESDLHFMLCLCATHLLVQLVVTRGGNSDRQSQRRPVSPHGTETEVFCRISTSNPPPAFDPEENPRTVAMYWNSSSMLITHPLGISTVRHFLSFFHLDRKSRHPKDLLTLSLLPHGGLYGGWWFLYALLSWWETTPFHKTHLLLVPWHTGCITNRLLPRRKQTRLPQGREAFC